MIIYHITQSGISGNQKPKTRDRRDVPAQSSQTANSDIEAPHRLTTRKCQPPTPKAAQQLNPSNPLFRLHLFTLFPPSLFSLKVADYFTDFAILVLENKKRALCSVESGGWPERCWRGFRHSVPPAVLPARLHQKQDKTADDSA